MPVHYYQIGMLQERFGVMPNRASCNGYANVRINVNFENLFNMAWTFKYNAERPMIYHNGATAVHPALERLVTRTAEVNFTIRNHLFDRRAAEIARRGRQAARLGLRVDRNGHLLNADDASSEE